MAYPKKARCAHGHRFTKENTYFNPASKARKCKTCTKAEAHSTRYRKRRKQRFEEKQVWINDYLKSHPCIDCGEADPLVLVFDHCRGKKKRDVTGLTAMSVASISKEINKCDVVCANDHARRTAKRANTIRWRLNK